MNTEQAKKSKTNEWQIGNCYSTIKTKEVYIGTVYTKVTYKTEYYNNRVEINKTEKALKYVTIPFNYVKDMTCFSELFKKINSELDKNYSIVLQGEYRVKEDLKTRSSESFYLYKDPLQYIDKLPSIKDESSFKLITDVNIQEEIDKLVYKLECVILVLHNKGMYDIRLFELQSMFVSSTTQELNVIEKEILNIAIEKITCTVINNVI